ncbi:hypothetical protein [Deinococcus peraridilitoris]|uniref:hypothetical protein n=1 Tax=Deinococcus peraridilitoris TaxID=432329 RepID=UPI0002ED21B9|nr:hypothetical protein [Deinococcus peraridilitoris]
MVPLVRHGYMEECYFDVSYTPVYVGRQVEGIFASVNEITDRVLATRRMQTLAALTTSLIGVGDLEHVARTALDVAAQNPLDLPFALLYLPDVQGEFQLAKSVGLSETQLRSWQRAPAHWSERSLAGALAITPLAAGPWPEPVREVALSSLMTLETATPLGLLVTGINARKHLDESYRDFLRLFSAQVASALHSARLSEVLRLRHAELEARTRALEAFEVWTRDLGIDTDPFELIGQAQALLSSLLPVDVVVY